MDLLELAQKLGLDTGDAPQVRQSLCLNTRFRQRACTICQDVCPVGAITVFLGETKALAPPKVTLDEEACARCGLCLHACPTGAFQHPARPVWQRRLHENVRALAPSALELLCPVQEQGETDAPVAARLQTGRCLAALSLGDLIDMVRRQPEDLWLDDRACATCPLAAVHDDILEIAQQANRLLEAWGHPARVRTHTLAPDDLGENHAVPVYKGHVSALSRRQLFDVFRGNVTRVAAAVAAEKWNPPAPEPRALSPRERLSYHLPPQRRHLTAALQRLGSPQQETIDLEGLPWTVVQIGEACTACGLCARFCPTAAIRFYTQFPSEEHPGHFTLTFVPPDCVDCGVCILACPEEALSYVNMTYTEWLATREEALLHEGELVPCEDCGQPTTPGDPPLCFTCKARRARSAQLGHRLRDLLG